MNDRAPVVGDIVWFRMTGTLARMVGAVQDWNFPMVVTDVRQTGATVWVAGDVHLGDDRMFSVIDIRRGREQGDWNWEVPV